MPLDFLRKIEHAAFPLRVEDPREIQCVEVLRAAELVEAAVTPGQDTEAAPVLAIVLRITPLGRGELARGRGERLPFPDWPALPPGPARAPPDGH